MTDIVEVPALVLATEFPTSADRDAATWNSKAYAWANSVPNMSSSVYQIALAGYTNAIAAQERAAYADQRASSAATSATESADARDEAQTLRDQTESLRDSAQVAASAAAAGAGLPALIGNARKKLSVRADELGVEWSGTTPEQRVITASANINKAMFGEATMLYIELWGAGGSGAVAAYQSGSQAMQSPGGAEGGDYVAQLLPISALPPTFDIIIGAGGASVSRSTTIAGDFQSGVTPGNSGGITTALGLLARGGLGGQSNSGASQAGTIADYVGGRGSSASVGGGSSKFGGGGGGGCNINTGNLTMPGSGFSNATGGNALLKSSPGGVMTASTGGAPGCGGGAAACQSTGWLQNPITSGAGGNGQARLTWW